MNFFFYYNTVVINCKVKLKLQDENGTGLLHKAVYYNHRDIADWLMDKYPESMSVRDNVSTKLPKYPCLKRGNEN